MSLDKTDSVRLDPREFAEAFPFHLAYDRGLRLLQAGSSVRRACPDLLVGQSFREIFRVLRPEHTEVSWPLIERDTSGFYLIEHLATGLQLRGGFKVVGDGQQALFLGSPWCLDTAELGARGISMADFAVHDPTADLLHLFNAHKLALSDAKRFADKLTIDRNRLRELTGQLKAREAEHRRLAIAVARSRNGVVVTDRMGYLEWVNDGFTQMTGYEANEAIGRRPGELLQGPGTDRRAIQRIRNCLESREPVTETLLNFRKDGTPFWIQLDIEPIFDAEGRLENFVAVQFDVTAERESLQRLQASEERFFKAFRSSPVGAAIGSLVDDRLLDVNDRLCEIVGYRRDELLGRRPTELGLWDDPDQAALQKAQLVDHDAVHNVELRVRDRSGALHDLLASLQRIFLGGEPAALFYCSDVTSQRRTDRRRAVEHAVVRVMATEDVLEKALPRVLETLCLSEGWSFGDVWWIEPSVGAFVCQGPWRAAQPELQALEWQTRNRRLPLDQGLPGVVLSQEQHILVSQLPAEPQCCRALAAVRAGMNSALGFPIHLAGRIVGVMTFFGPRGQVVETQLAEILAGVATLIGQFISRKRAQDELVRLVTLSPNVLYSLRLGPSIPRPLWRSENVTALTGCPVAESLADEWWIDRLHPEDRQRALDAITQPRGQEPGLVEYRLRHRDGHYRWIADHHRALIDANGTPVEIVGAWADVTERRELEARLLQTQKIEAVGSLSGGIAHDFNNILASVLVNAEVAEASLEPGHEARDRLRDMIQAAHRGAGLVRQILTFARRTETRRARVNLRPIFEESIRLLRATIPAGVDMQVAIQDDLPCVDADETQIQQIIVNLGTNAWHACDGRDARIQFALESLDIDASFARTLGSPAPGRHVRIRVRDNGRGMDSASLRGIAAALVDVLEGANTGEPTTIEPAMFRLPHSRPLAVND